MKATVVSLVYVCFFFFKNVNQILKKCNQDLQADIAVEKKKISLKLINLLLVEYLDKKLMHRNKKPISSYMQLKSCCKTKPNMSTATADLLQLIPLYFGYSTQHPGNSVFMKSDMASLLKVFDIHIQS